MGPCFILSSLPPALPRESHDSYNTSTLAARAAVFVKTWFLGVRNRVFGLCVVFCFVVRDTTPVAGKQVCRVRASFMIGSSSECWGCSARPFVFMLLLVLLKDVVTRFPS